MAADIEFAMEIFEHAVLLIDGAAVIVGVSIDIGRRPKRVADKDSLSIINVD